MSDNNSGSAAFKGFSIPNGFTQTPNEFWDLLIRNELSLIEIRLLGFMIRYTFGWRKDGFCLQFSLNDLVKVLKFTKKTARQAIDSCIEKGYIEHTERYGQNFYRLVLDEDSSKAWDFEFDWKDKVNWEELNNNKKGDLKDDPSLLKDNPGDLNDNPSDLKDDPGDLNDNTRHQIDNSTGDLKDNLEVFQKITGKAPEMLMGQGVTRPLNKVLNKSINILKEEEDEDPLLIANRDSFIREVVNRIKLPANFIQQVQKEIDFSLYNPEPFSNVMIKFVNRMRLGQIDSNIMNWLKKTLDNEQVLYFNKIMNT